MKTSYKLLALMVALATGAASAAAPTGTSAGTTAGQTITNIATATFTDPSNPANTPSVNSNPVVTTVLPLTGFDVVYTAGADGTSASTPVAAYDLSDKTPGSVVPTTYTVVNNSNIDNYVINLTPDTNGTTSAPTSVKYYPAGTTFDPVTKAPSNPEITSVTVRQQGVVVNGTPSTGTIDIVQAITIPTTATPGQQFSASPHGIAPAGTAPGGNAYAAVDEKNNVNPPATTPTNNDSEFTRVTVATPSLTPKPPADTDPKTPPLTPPVTPGPGTTPPPNTPNPTNPTYNPPTNPGGTPNPGTVIAVDPTSGDQNAYPKSDNNTAADVVTFVSDVKNNGTIADQVVIKPDTSGLPAGTTIKVLDKAGNVLTPDANGKYNIPYDPANPATLTPAGGTATYQLVVTYPDSDSTPADPVITVPVALFSGVVPTATPLATSTFKIFPPNILFGDTPNTAAAGFGNSGNSTANVVTTPTVEERVIPGGATSVTSALQTDGSAVFPMTIKNNGQYDEAYTLSAPAIVFKDINGVNLPAASVTYYDSTGAALPAGVTPVIPVGTTANFYAVVNVPTNAAATTSGGGTQPDQTLTQTATGNYSGDTLTDNNDFVSVGYNNSGITVVKQQSVTPVAPHANAGVATPFAITPASAAPGDALNYKIVATNTYNGPVKNFKLTDAAADIFGASKYVNFVSATVKLTGFGATKNIYYSVNGGTNWTLATDSTAFTPTVTASGIQVYVDTDGVLGANNAPTAGDVVPASATVELDINTTVK